MSKEIKEVIIIFKPGTAGSSIDHQRRRERLILTQACNANLVEYGYIDYIDEKGNDHIINKDIIEEVIIKYEETK